MFSGFSIFVKAYEATKHQIWVSTKLLLLVTLLFAVMMFIAENSVNSDYSFFDALIWTFVKYVEDPADIVSPPVTVLGQVIGTLNPESFLSNFRGSFQSLFLKKVALKIEFLPLCYYIICVI